MEKHRGRISRISPSGFGILTSVSPKQTVEEYTFTFDKISNYRGQTVDELGLHQGKTVDFTTEDERVTSIDLSLQK
jgi:hypothetical protein